MNYSKSNDYVRKTKKVIPMAAQTRSRSFLGLPKNYPKALKFCYNNAAMDLDGNEYIDLTSGLGSIILGEDDIVNQAVVDVIDSSAIGLSLPNKMELELAELFMEYVPCAKMVQFAKNGSDVTTAAIRLARAYTEREWIMHSGYHGWHDWSKEDPKLKNKNPIQTFSVLIPKNLEYIHKHLETKTYAAVIIDPMNYYDIEKIKKIKKLCRQYGTLLIFDEVLTGFRVHIGGFQALTGIISDLACFGKAMGNGYPISALAGKKKYMNQLIENVFFSTTHGGDLIGIAAAIATIKQIKKQEVCNYLKKQGSYLEKKIKDLIKKHTLCNYISINGYSQLTTIHFREKHHKLKFMELMAENGVLFIGRNILNFSHKKSDIDVIIEAYDKSFKEFKKWLKQ